MNCECITQASSRTCCIAKRAYPPLPAFVDTHNTKHHRWRDQQEPLICFVLKYYRLAIILWCSFHQNLICVVANWTYVRMNCLNPCRPGERPLGRTDGDSPQSMYAGVRPALGTDRNQRKGKLKGRGTRDKMWGRRREELAQQVGFDGCRNRCVPSHLRGSGVSCKLRQ